LDTFDYLADAAEFAGHSIGYTDLNRPPFISFLTAIFFINGNLSITPIFFVDGILYVLGCIGLFLFLKERFNSLLSFIGGLLFATFPVVVTYSGAGFNDVSSVGLAIWALYLTYISVEKNSKWFLLAFPIAMLAFLTRFNMALLVFPIFLFILINWGKIKNHWNLLIGIILSLLVILPFVIFLGMKFGNPLYVFLDFFGSSSSMVGAGNYEHFAYHPDQLYFLKNLPAYLGVQSVMVVLLTFFAVLLTLIKKWKKLVEKKKFSIRMNNELKIKFILLVILISIFILTFGKFNYLVTELLFFILAYLGYDLSIKLGFKGLKMDFIFFTWFMAFFIFQSIYVVKDHRYFITMAPPMAYFLVRLFSWAVNQLKITFRDRNLTLYVGAVFLSLLMIFSAFSQLPGIEKENENSKLFNQDAQQASYWLMSYDPEYKSKVIYADLWSYFAWYLKMNVGKMPIFKNNQTMYVGPRDYNFTKEDNEAFERELERTHPDYYISAWKGMNFTSYVVIQRFGTITIFKRVDVN
jgi:4-amino-4-deoxy-L-arabinose transferase-like glycosyltransferase